MRFITFFFHFTNVTVFPRFNSFAKLESSTFTHVTVFPEFNSFAELESPKELVWFKRLLGVLKKIPLNKKVLGNFTCKVV